jgi:mannonate dehydratase
MRLSFLFFSDKPEIKWDLVKQMGIKYAIAKLPPELTGKLPPWDFDSLRQSKEAFSRYGFDLIGLEGDQMDMTRIKLGLPGRDEDLVRYKQMLVNMGKLGIKLLCYNFMPTGWFRTTNTLAERGGAMVTGYDDDVAARLQHTLYGEVSADTIWRNYTYFIRQVMPVAEAAGVRMALHPDDPPVPSLQGISRIFIHADAIRQALALVDSPCHGLTFCQGTFVAMGENVYDLVKEFAAKQQLFFVHVRDVKGTAEHFRETFHDNGPTDMPRMFRLYKEVGFDGAIRSDHVPTMAGERNSHAGYEMSGNLFGIGYMRGIMDTLKI